jgi:hypothetical protein
MDGTADIELKRRECSGASDQHAGPAAAMGGLEALDVAGDVDEGELGNDGERVDSKRLEGRGAERGLVHDGVRQRAAAERCRLLDRRDAVDQQPHRAQRLELAAALPQRPRRHSAAAG